MEYFNGPQFSNTYSIVAYDEIKKQIGVGMQTHNFAACNRAAWAKPGVGVIATQGYTNPLYAFKGFKMMKHGLAPNKILGDLIRQDSDYEFRQVAMMDAHGNMATHTGSKCIMEAGHCIGRDYACQANMMAKNTAWSIMGTTFEKSQGQLVDRIIEALKAAESEGGDIRGAQSAAIIVVSSVLTDEPWRGFLYDFKVYDNSKPLQELQRLVNTKKAHDYVEAAFEQLYCGDSKAISMSLEHFSTAIAEIPNEDSKLQHQFYYALSLLKKGAKDEGISLLRTVCNTMPMWKTVALRIARSEKDEDLYKIIDII